MAVEANMLEKVVYWFRGVNTVVGNVMWKEFNPKGEAMANWATFFTSVCAIAGVWAAREVRLGNWDLIEVTAKAAQLPIAVTACMGLNLLVKAKEENGRFAKARDYTLGSAAVAAAVAGEALLLVGNLPQMEIIKWGWGGAALAAVGILGVVPVWNTIVKQVKPGEWSSQAHKWMQVLMPMAGAALGTAIALSDRTMEAAREQPTLWWGLVGLACLCLENQKRFRRLIREIMAEEPGVVGFWNMLVARLGFALPGIDDNKKVGGMVSSVICWLRGLMSFEVNKEAVGDRIWRIFGLSLVSE